MGLLRLACRVRAILTLTAAGFLLIPSTGSHAIVSEPPHLIGGTVSVAGLPRTWGRVAVRLTGGTVELASCAIGTLGTVPDGYLLQVPMDAMDPRDPETAREGDAVELLLDGEVVATGTIGGRGLFQAVALSVPSPTHAVSFLREPTALPASVEAGGSVYCDAEAVDSLGHPIGYLWSASCPGDPGSFDADAAPSPVWTAPAPPGPDPWVCELSVTADDGQGLVASRTLLVEVAPAPASGPVAVPEAVPNPASCGQTILFDGSASWHGIPGLGIVSWEWDFDYDGLTFTPEALGVTATHSYGISPGPFLAALRVTDDGQPPASAIGTMTVDPVGLNRPPIAVAGGPYVAGGGQPLQLVGSGSTDLDAACGDSIAAYSWDLDNNGTFGDASGASPLLPWSDVALLVCGGSCEHGVAYPIALRVTDSRGGEDVAATTVTPALLLFAEDFSDGAGAGDPDWQKVRGTWRVRGSANKYLRSSSTRKNNITVPLAFPDPAPAALRLESRLALLTKFRKYPNAYLLFAWQDARHYRYVQLAYKRRRYFLKLGQAGAIGADGAGIRRSKRIAGARLKKWSRVRVDAYPDGWVHVYWNNATTPALSYQFLAAAPGGYGVRAHQAWSKFDDFSVWNAGVLP